MATKNLLTTFLFILIFIFFFVLISSGLSMTARAASDIEWVEKQSTVKMYWGDSVTMEDYVIKAEDFNNNSVFVSISKEGERLIAAPLSEGMDITCDDEIKVFAQRIDPNYETVTKNGKEFQTKNSNPYAELNIYVRGEPKFDIQVVTDKDIYDSKSAGDSKILVAINIAINGDAEAEDTLLTIDTAGLELLKGKTEYRNTVIHKNETLKPINLTLKTPAPWDDTSFNITSIIAYKDIKGKKFESAGSKTITVKRKWDLLLSKVFPEERYLGETVPFSVNVRNTGLCDIDNIILNDSIVPGMHLNENKTLKKTISLKSGEKADKILDYSLVPEATGEFSIPECTAIFTLPNGLQKKISSDNSGTIKINGPDISVSKTVDKQQLNIGDTLNVTVTAQNDKKINLNVRLNDTLPPGAKLVRGETSSKQILKSEGGSMSINYTMQMNTEGDIKLPACKANFTDVAKNSLEIDSNTPIVHIVTPNSLEANKMKSEEKNESGPIAQETNESSKSSQQGNNSSGMGQIGNTNGNNGATPGFALIPSIIGFLLVAGLLRKRSN